jgi:hypothetical protein
MSQHEGTQSVDEAAPERTSPSTAPGLTGATDLTRAGVTGVGPAGSLSPGRVLGLQRSIGNRAVGRLIARQQAPMAAVAESEPPELELPYLDGEQTNELYTIMMGVGSIQPLRDPTPEEARRVLFNDLLSRQAFDLAAKLETARIVRYSSQETGEACEELRDPAGAPIARIHRGWSFFLLQPWVEVRWLRNTVGPATGRRTPDGAPGIGPGSADPFAESYRKHFPQEGVDGNVTRTDEFMRIRLALELADTSFLGELEEAFVNAVRDPAFIATTILTIGIYVGLWLTPDPSMITKIAAGILTAVMLILFSWQDLWGFCSAWIDISTAAHAAITEDQLRIAGDAFLTKLGQVGFDVLLMLMFWGIEKGAGPKVRAGAKARATARADVRATELRNAPGAGGRVQASDARVRLVPDAQASAGTDATPTQVLDSLSEALPTDDAKRGLSQFRAKGSDADALKAVEGRQRAREDVVRWLEEQAMSPEQKAAAKQAAAEAEADAALKRIRQIADDPALAEPTKRAGWIRNIIAVIDAIMSRSLRLREAVRARNVRDLVGILGEVMSRAELKRQIGGLKGFEIESDLEVARKVDGVSTVNEWLQAQIKAWEAGGKRGPKPGSRDAAKMRTRGNEVWESLGQADNVIVERKPGGQLRIDTIEETKTGGETGDAARQQVEGFREQLGAIGDGTSTARVFDRAGPQELGADRTGDLDLKSARAAKTQTRGLPGRDNYDAHLPVDRPALEGAAQQLIDRGLPREDTAGPPPATPQHRKQDPVAAP